jgi:hypothetical protein
MRPYLYRTRDGGKTWVPIVNGLPDFGPVDTVREDPVRKGLLFAGTENAVWVSFDDGDHWQSLQLNLPHTSMRDLWIHDNDLIVATHGRGFWIIDDISPLRDTAVLKNEAHLYAPAPAYRMQRDTNTDTPLPPDEPAAPNPPDGAILDYYLPAAANSVTIEVLDGQNHVVRRYSSGDKPDMSEEELHRQLIPLYWVREFHKLSTEAGTHRWIWDLHYTPPATTRHDYPIAAIPHDTPRYPLGPNALPGKYTVRLTVDGKSLMAPLSIKMDPRVKVTTAALEKKFDAEKSLASIFNDTSVAALQGGSIRIQLEKLSADEKTKGAVEAFEEKLNAVLGAEGRAAAAAPEISLTRVNGEAATLYGQVWQVDAEPTTAQIEAGAVLKRESADVMKRWTDFSRTELPDMNRMLRQAHIPEIDAHTNLEQEDVLIDEE